jgi:exopolysaccharide biosynthesis predicted pyruvyltransferase EpsI
MGEMMSADLPPSSAVVSSWASASDSALLPLVSPGSAVALLDFPYHDNFGDAAIWSGERVWLGRHGITVRYLADVGRYDAAELAALHPEGPILLHGGGNFGDIWPEHQTFRESVLRDFPDRVIVQMPQTLGFGSSAEQARVADAMAWHEQFTVLVRDERSLGLAREMGLTAELVPDAALNLGRLARRGRSRNAVLVLARTDHEGSGLLDYVLANPDPHQVVADWHLPAARRHLWTGMKTLPRAVRRLEAGSSPRLAVVRRLSPVYDAMAELMVRAAVRQLSAADVVVTDRLHAHVIASLVGIPHVVLDNNYGKVKGVFDAFTHTAPAAVFAESPAAAIELARGLVE